MVRGASLQNPRSSNPRDHSTPQRTARPQEDNAVQLGDRAPSQAGLLTLYACLSIPPLRQSDASQSIARAFPPIPSSTASTRMERPRAARRDSVRAERAPPPLSRPYPPSSAHHERPAGFSPTRDPPAPHAHPRTRVVAIDRSIRRILPSFPPFPPPIPSHCAGERGIPPIEVRQSEKRRRRTHEPQAQRDMGDDGGREMELAAAAAAPTKQTDAPAPPKGLNGGTKAPYILDDDEDDWDVGYDGMELLDWDQYARIRRRRCCGVPIPHIPAPMWYARLPRRRRRRLLIVACLAFAVGVVALFALASLASGGATRTASVKEGGANQPDEVEGWDVDWSADPACSWTDLALPAPPIGPSPAHYDLALDLAWAPAWHVDGEVAIELEAAHPARPRAGGCVVLHVAPNVRVASAHFEGTAPIDVAVGAYSTERQQQTLMWRAAPAAKGSGGGGASASLRVLRFAFAYPLDEGLRGLYRSRYLPATSSSQDGAEGEMKDLVSTQMEATDARRVLPCFDEPAFKATFASNVTITRPAFPHERHLKAFGWDARMDEAPAPFAMPAPTGEAGPAFAVLFNTPSTSRLLSRAPAPGGAREAEGPWVKDAYAFQRTPRMSTYLLALVVGELEAKAAVLAPTPPLRPSPIRVAVWGTPGRAPSLTNALEATVKILPAYEGLFALAFPLPKLDLVAIPAFEAGAMENWGLITYRETALLVQEGEASESDAFWAHITIAHELAHMWFGNLVTMKVCERASERGRARQNRSIAMRGYGGAGALFPSLPPLAM